MERRVATQAARYTPPGAASSKCSTACQQAVRTALREAAKPGALPVAARSPQHFAAQLKQRVANALDELPREVSASVRATYKAAAHDAIDSFVKGLTHTLRTAAVSGAAGVAGTLGWERLDKWLREVNSPETSEEMLLLQQVDRKIDSLRKDTRNSRP